MKQLASKMEKWELFKISKKKRENYNLHFYQCFSELGYFIKKGLREFSNPLR